MVDSTNNGTPAELAQAQRDYAELQRYEMNWPAQKAANTQAATQRAAQAKKDDAALRARQNWTPKTSNGGKRGK